MTKHLPECYYGAAVRGGHVTDCICDRLRQAEQRVLTEAAARTDYVYEQGIKAARRAVERKTWISVYELSDESKAYNKGIRTALAAIDALGARA